MTRRSYLLFLAFIWIALIYIIVAFTDITASTFVGVQKLENGQTVSGAGIATSSLLYMALPLVMGLLLRYTKLSLGLATAIFLPLVGVAIWIGQSIPFDLGAILGISNVATHKVWDVALLVYCFVASIIPIWLLLQPRGYLGGYFLYVALAGGALGLLFGGKTIQYPAFTGWTTAKGETLFPILFITIACGACSGFHALIASGTTSKQLRRETDARVIGYGTMLLEALVAILSLATVMMLARTAPILQKPQPNFIYAQGIGSFLEVIGIPAALGISFGLMAFTTFVYDTLDVCTRLGRYILQELTGWHDRKGSLLATALTAGILFFLLRDNGSVPVWRTFWALFGASNQLLAALTLLGITVWLVRSQRAAWAWIVTGLPTVFMYVMSVWALVIIIRNAFVGPAGFHLTADPVPWIGIVLVGLAALMLIEAIKVIGSSAASPPPSARVGGQPAAGGEWERGSAASASAT